jgi:fructose-1,6-bisphosphatase/inositol monophosphatase family enzyme
MAPWDSAALVTCVREAGGVCTQPRVFSGSQLSAASRPLLEAALGCIGPAR